MLVTAMFLVLIVLVQDISVREWRNFKLAYNKTYTDVADEEFRFSIFKVNKDQVAKHNKLYSMGKESYQLDLNEFSDMWLDEILDTLTGLNTTFADYEANSSNVEKEMLSAIVQLPASVDWRTRGAVLPIKRQGRCGSCWAFAAIGALEAQHFLKTGQLTKLSEQNLIDCCRKNHGCHGGTTFNALNYIKWNHGIDTAQSYPYHAREQKCQFSETGVGATVNHVVVLPPGNEQKLLEAVALRGPVAVGIQMTGNLVRYKSGVFDDPQCSGSLRIHAVLVVGYGTEGGRPYWLVRNSWGVRWGEAGYIKMARGKNLCGIAQRAAYPVV